MQQTFKIGSRGFLIQRLQRAVDIKADGIFGPQTAAAINNTEAGPAEYSAAGLGWPDDFERAMNLVSCFEGTSFGDCNLHDIDGAGLTFGIAGFTTKHGEVQELLARHIARAPAALDILPAALQNALLALLSRRAAAGQWRDAFYGPKGSVLPAWRSALAAWGEMPSMQTLQLQLARERFWEPAVVVAQSLGFSSLQAYTFFLDVAVQNGGWRKSHLVMAKRMIDWFSEDESKALAVAARAVAACAREEWRNDVLARKMAIATARGVVHGREYDLRKFGMM
jgi:hypothetical protein